MRENYFRNTALGYSPVLIGTHGANHVPRFTSVEIWRPRASQEVPLTLVDPFLTYDVTVTASVLEELTP